VRSEQLEHEAGYVRASLRLVSVEDGCPAAGISSGARPNWGIGQRLSGDGLLARAPVTLETGEGLAPGETGLVRIHPRSWEAWRSVRPGDRIPMLRGPRIVGVAEVVDVVRPG
jgi:hypothetical protein